MSLDDIRNEVAKGLKTYKVFNELDTLLQEMGTLKNDFHNCKKAYDVLKQNVVVEQNTLNDIKDEIGKLKQESKKIVSDAKIKADQIVKNAVIEAADIVAKAEQSAAKIAADNKAANSNLSNLMKELEKFEAERNKIFTEIEKTKEKFRSIL